MCEQDNENVELAASACAMIGLLAAEGETPGGILTILTAAAAITFKLTMNEDAVAATGKPVREVVAEGLGDAWDWVLEGEANGFDWREALAVATGVTFRIAPSHNADGTPAEALTTAAEDAAVRAAE